MTKVGGTAKRSKVKSPTKTTAQRIDVSASWTGPDSGIEVWCHKVFFLNFKYYYSNIIIEYSTALQYSRYMYMALHKIALQYTTNTLHFLTLK